MSNRFLIRLAKRTGLFLKFPFANQKVILEKQHLQQKKYLNTITQVDNEEGNLEKLFELLASTLDKFAQPYAITIIEKNCQTCYYVSLFWF